MKFIETLDELHNLYGRPSAASTRKVAQHLIPEYSAWIARSRFCIFVLRGP